MTAAMTAIVVYAAGMGRHEADPATGQLVPGQRVRGPRSGHLQARLPVGFDHRSRRGAAHPQQVPLPRSANNAAHSKATVQTAFLEWLKDHEVEDSTRKATRT